MVLRTVTEPGFHAGRFLKPGQSWDDGVDLDGLTKDELIALAAEREVEIRSGDTKPEIIKALSA